MFLTEDITSWLVQLLKSPAGLNSQVESLAHHAELPPPGEIRLIAAQNAAPDLVERSQQTRYPAVFVYSDKLVNSLKEKFRVFSGAARLVIEVRCSQERLEGIERKLNLYMAGVCKVLDNARGEWATGVYYSGGYEVTFGAVRAGGQDYLQTAKVVFEVNVSR